MGVDLRQRLSVNLRAALKVGLGRLRFALGSEMPQLFTIAGLTTSLLQWAGAMQMRTNMTSIMAMLITMILMTHRGVDSFIA